MNTTTMDVLGLTTDGHKAPTGEEDSKQCELLGSFALFVQGALGALALLSLVWKRAREHPQRPLLIWFFDVSKQVWGSILVHIANLLLSMLSSGQFSTEPTPKVIDDKYHANPCSFYLLNLAIDTTVGIFILIVILRVLHRTLLALPFEFWHTGITSGEYGDPPRWSWWGKQAIVYFVGLMGMKFVVWLMFEIFPWLGRFGDWLLGWTEGDKRVQVFFVMFFFPLVMNGVQYYIIDSYIKSQKPLGSASHDTTGAIPSSARSSYSRQNRMSFDDGGNIFLDEDDDDSSNLNSNVEERNLLTGRSKSTSTTTPNGHHKLTPSLSVDYNPDIDGISPKPTPSPSGRQYPARDPDSEASSTYHAVKSGQRSVGKRNTMGLRSIDGGENESLTSSMMLLPGSRGPSTPGYADGDEDGGSRRTMLGDGRSVGGRSNRSVGGRSGQSGTSFGGDDESTLVGKEEDAER